MNWDQAYLGELIAISKGKKHISNIDGVNRYINIENLHNPLNSMFTNESGVFVEPEDVVIAWDGANAGKVGVGFKGVIGSTLARLKTKQEGIDSRFLFWFLESKNETIKSQRTGATIPHVNGPALRDLLIPLPPLPVQQRITAILDAADALRRKDKELLKKYDELAQAIFIDMFGDPVKNEKGWNTEKIGNFGDLKNGLNYSSNKQSYTLKILGVGDFKNKWLLDEFNELSIITIENNINSNYLLKNE